MANNPYQQTLSYFVWICLLIATVLIMRPAIGETSKKSISQKKYARDLVEKYGQNPASYLALEDDKELFWGQDVEGLICYGKVSEVLIVMGDPICADDDFPKLLGEWHTYCLENEYNCVFIGTTDKFIENYKLFGYGIVKYGEEGRFDLTKLQERSTGTGFTIHEYKPNEKREEDIEDGFRKVSLDWLGGEKKSNHLQFSIGRVNLKEPLSRRYFYAKNSSGKIIAFSTFIPFDSMDGYAIDVSRHMRDCSSEVTEQLLYYAFKVFADEGVHWGSVGLAPLVNIINISNNRGKPSLTAKILNMLYHNGNKFYGFKYLHKTKERYGPDMWLPGYLVFTEKELTPQMAYAITRIQNPAGIGLYILDFLKRVK